MSQFLSRAALTATLAAMLLLGGCDKQKEGDEQPSDAATANIDDGTVPEVSGASAPTSTKSGESSYEIVRTNAGKPLPDVSFTGDDDVPVSLADFKGKPMLLNLWATWCVPCVREMPTLDALAAKTAGKLQVVTVSQDLKGKEVVDPWFTKHGYKNIKAYLDPDVNLSLQLQAPGLPLTILVDKEGKEILRVAGDLDWNGPEAAKLLAEAGI